MSCIPRLRRPHAQFSSLTCCCASLLQEVLVTLKECIAKNSKAVLAAEDETMLAYVSAQAARLIDAKVFTPSEWSSKVRAFTCRCAQPSTAWSHISAPNLTKPSHMSDKSTSSYYMGRFWAGSSYRHTRLHVCSAGIRGPGSVC